MRVTDQPSSLSYLEKRPAPAPSWVRPWREAVVDASLDAYTPSRRARLVSEALTHHTANPDRDTWVRRFAVYLDLNAGRGLLYELEREVSPGLPIEQFNDHIEARVDRIVRGAAA